MASSKLFIPIFALMFVLLSLCEAKEILFGGHENSWKIPPSADALNKWAANTQFEVGDILILKYNGKTDSVVEVNKEDYQGCKTSKPIKQFNDGNTKIELNHTGPFYFISGAQGHCEMRQKVEVTVVSDKHQPENHGSSPVAAPARAPTKSSGGDGLMMMTGVGLVGAIVGLGLVFV